MPNQTEIEIPDEGETVELKETPATEEALEHADEFEVQETRWRKAPSLTGGHVTVYTTTITPKGEDTPFFQVPTETIIAD